MASDNQLISVDVASRASKKCFLPASIHSETPSILCLDMGSVHAPQSDPAFENVITVSKPSSSKDQTLSSKDHIHLYSGSFDLNVIKVGIAFVERKPPKAFKPLVPAHVVIKTITIFKEASDLPFLFQGFTTEHVNMLSDISFLERVVWDRGFFPQTSFCFQTSFNGEIVEVEVQDAASERDPYPPG